MRFRKPLALVAAVMFSVAIASGCSAQEPAAAPAPAAVPAPVVPAPPAPVYGGEDQYYSFIVSRGLPVERSTALSIGNTTCDLLRTQGPAATVEAIGTAAENSGLPLQAAATFAGGAVVFLCPDQKAALESYLNN